MSYSCSARVANKSLAKEAVAVEFDKIVASQPIHARDRAAVLANASAVIDLLADDATKDVAVSFNGSVYGSAADEPLFRQVSINCTASHTPRLLTPGQ